jgi:hypothetical protein
VYGSDRLDFKTITRTGMLPVLGEKVAKPDEGSSPGTHQGCPYGNDRAFPMVGAALVAARCQRGHPTGVPGEGRFHQLPINRKAWQTAFSRVLVGEGGEAR